MTSLQEKRADRLRFLHAVYEIVEDRRDLSISSWELADEIEMDRVRSSYIVDYLVAEGLLQRTHGNGGIGITHDGIKEVEAALLKPEEETTYFPPAMNIIHIGTNIGSPILQGGEGNTQIVSKDEVVELREILQTLQEPELLAALPEADRKEALAQIRTAAAQVEAQEPDRGVVRRALEKLLPIVKSSAEVAGQVNKLLDFAGRFGIGA